MSKFEKLLIQILHCSSDTNILFSDLRGLLRKLGFVERIRGSHHLFRKEDVEERINLQKDGNKAKPYQVKQVRNIISKYNFGEKNDEQI